MKVYVSLDNDQYSSKPVREIPSIKKRACNNWRLIELKELAKHVGEHGQAFIPGHLVGGMKAENCTSMQLFALDFDGEENREVSFEEIQTRSESFGLPIAFAYHTFSSSKEHERFRVVFAHEYLIDDPYIIQITIYMFQKLFPECDRACKNLDRIFLGGKKLIYLNAEGRYAWEQLLSSYKEFFSKQGNLSRELKYICNHFNILRINDAPAMGVGEYFESIKEKIDENATSTINHKVEGAANSSIWVIEKGEDFLKDITCPVIHKNIDITDCQGCQLINDFKNGEPLNYQSRFAIYTNVMNVRGGEKWFFNVMEKFYNQEQIERLKRNRQYIKGLPQRCSDSFCIYYNSCERSSTILEAISSKRKIIKEKHEKYASIDEAYEFMKMSIESAVNSAKQGIHLIKSQTALGKTSAYIQIIAEHLEENPEEKFLIAAPTNELKKDIAKDLNLKGGLHKEQIFVTPSVKNNSFIPIDVREKIEELHMKGYHKEAKDEIADYYDSVKKDPDKPAVAEECKTLLEGVNAVKNQNVIVTTHAMLLQTSEAFLENYTVVVDEDILYLQLFNHTYNISIEILQKIVEKKLSNLSSIASTMINAEEGKYYRLSPISFPEAMTEEELENFDLFCDDSDNINDLLNAGSFVKKKDWKSGELSVKYFCPQKLSKGKYIVLSASANVDIYKRYFGPYLDVIEYPYLKAAYRGRVIQYADRTLGRQSLDTNLDVFDQARKLSSDPDFDIITFKRFEKIAKSRNGIHFGNCTGVNKMQGHDLAVIGTPYKTDEAYKLFACYLGADVNKYQDSSPKPRRVHYNGYSFVITTYDDELLQKIQLYSFESDLEQAVGRARVLRKDCTVYVFSSFPCDQAKIQENEDALDPEADKRVHSVEPKKKHKPRNPLVYKASILAGAS